MDGETRKAIPVGIIGAAALLCLPCLLPVLAVLVGAGALTGFGGWISANALLAGLGGGTVLAACALLATALIARKRRAAACAPRDRQAAMCADARRQV
ncbi:MAG: hypothetical protein KGK07_13870 [Chloroflexota bacterium]|nr:hypothetical protein [Chloroflexota bacterium]